MSRLKLFRYFVFAVLFCLFSLPSFAEQTEDSAATVFEFIGEDFPIEGQDARVYIVDNFRIFYFTSGENVIDFTDVDDNDIPDYVENVAKQFWATQHVLSNIYDFPRVHELPYYSDVTYLDVYIVSRETLQGVLGVTSSGTEQSPLASEGTLSLRMMVSKGFNFSYSSTIPHEYFHIIQNGMSRIKNKWYFEGLARWVENLLIDKEHFLDPRWDYQRLIDTSSVLSHIHSLSYDAGQFFWVPFSMQMGEDSGFTLAENDPLHSLTYSDGSKVLQDTVIAGIDLILTFLEQLHLQDRRIEEDFGLVSWEDETPLHMRNNPYIMDAVEASLMEQQDQ